MRLGRSIPERVGCRLVSWRSGGGPAAGLPTLAEPSWLGCSFRGGWGLLGGLQGMPKDPGQRGWPWNQLCQPSGFLVGLVLLRVSEKRAGRSSCTW